MAIYKHFKVKIIMREKKTESFLSKIWNKTRMPTFTTFIHHDVEVLGRLFRQQKTIKGIKNEKMSNCHCLQIM
jgi:hypothetical protein